MCLQRCRFQRRFIATALPGFAPNCQFRAAATGLQKAPVRKRLNQCFEADGVFSLISLISLSSLMSLMPLFSLMSQIRHFFRPMRGAVGESRGGYFSFLSQSAKGRLKTISEELQPKLWAYMAGIAHNHGMNAVAIGGIADHVHVLLDLGPVLGIAKAVQVLKANSSRWMNEHSRTRFEWQEGYFACSVGKSQVATVRKYIENQMEHHRTIDSGQEFALLLQRHGLEVIRP